MNNRMILKNNSKNYYNIKRNNKVIKLVIIFLVLPLVLNRANVSETTKPMNTAAMIITPIYSYLPKRMESEERPKKEIRTA